MVASHPQALLPGQPVVGNKHGGGNPPAQQICRVHLPERRSQGQSTGAAPGVRPALTAAAQPQSDGACSAPPHQQALLCMVLCEATAQSDPERCDLDHPTPTLDPPVPTLD